MRTGACQSFPSTRSVFLHHKILPLWTKKCWHLAENDHNNSIWSLANRKKHPRIAYGIGMVSKFRWPLQSGSSRRRYDNLPARADLSLIICDKVPPFFDLQRQTQNSRRPFSYLSFNFSVYYYCFSGVTRLSVLSALLFEHRYSAAGFWTEYGWVLSRSEQYTFASCERSNRYKVFAAHTLTLSSSDAVLT